MYNESTYFKNRKYNYWVQITGMNYVIFLFNKKKAVKRENVSPKT